MMVNSVFSLLMQYMIGSNVVSCSIIPIHHLLDVTKFKFLEELFYLHKFLYTSSVVLIHLSKMVKQIEIIDT